MEDSDIIDQIENFGPMSTGTTLSTQQMKISALQIKSTLRTRKTMVDLDQSNKKFTLAIMFIAVVQVLIALFEFVFEVASSPSTKNIIGGLVLLGLCAFTVRFILKKFESEFGEKPAKETNSHL